MTWVWMSSFVERTWLNLHRLSSYTTWRESLRQQFAQPTPNTMMRTSSKDLTSDFWRSEAVMLFIHPSVGSSVFPSKAPLFLFQSTTPFSFSLVLYLMSIYLSESWIIYWIFINFIFVICIKIFTSNCEYLFPITVNIYKFCDYCIYYEYSLTCTHEYL